MNGSFFNLWRTYVSQVFKRLLIVALAHPAKN